MQVVTYWNHAPTLFRNRIRRFVTKELGLDNH